MSAANAIFWLSAAALAYTYAGYPLLLGLLSARRRRPEKAPREWLPFVSVIVPVHNERAHLAAKIANTLALDWPADRIEILIASDASHDGSDGIARRWQDPRVRLVRLDKRGGKARALNRAAREAGGEVLVFTDVSIIAEPDALRLLVSALSAPGVGCASACDVAERAEGEGLYARYDMIVRALEGRCAGAVGMSGSFYAVRREAREPFPAHVATDLYSGLRAALLGYRCVFEARARAHVGLVPGLGDEFRRKVRTLQTGMAAVWACRRLLLPRRPLFAWQLMSHKILRWATPFFMAGLLVGSAAARPPHTWALAAQLAFYALALLGWVWKARPARLAAFFCAAQAAAAAAWLRCAAGRRIEAWQPSRR